MRIGILGSGDVARVLGTAFMATGHEVRLGTRHPEQPELAAWLGKAGPKGSIGTPAQAAQFGEIVVIAVHGVAALEAIREAGPAHFDGKVVIDVTNPIAVGADGVPQLVHPAGRSNGEQIQNALPSAGVVKAFNIIGNPHMFHPTFPGGPPDMYICGNDAGAKKAVVDLLHDFGWPSVIDIGAIDGARELESLCILWVKSALNVGSWDIAFRLLRK